MEDHESLIDVTYTQINRDLMEQIMESFRIPYAILTPTPHKIPYCITYQSVTQEKPAAIENL